MPPRHRIPPALRRPPGAPSNQLSTMLDVLACAADAQEEADNRRMKAAIRQRLFGNQKGRLDGDQG